MTQVLELARLRGWLVYHPFDSRRSTPGWPDLTLVRAPEALFVELKSNTGRLTAPQRMWLAALRGCNLECHVWRPADWEQIAQRLSRR